MGKILFVSEIKISLSACPFDKQHDNTPRWARSNSNSISACPFQKPPKTCHAHGGHSELRPFDKTFEYVGRKRTEPSPLFSTSKLSLFLASGMLSSIPLSQHALS